ncbi:MAG TPA: Dabb family protein [Gemmataceae bacterium]|nr:Dabb family protein [Gemmataceae bacterium]
MRKRTAWVLVLGAALAAAVALGNRHEGGAAEADGPMLSHDVYFTLKDNSPAARKKLAAACKKYLSKHPGEVFFAAGTRAEELKRPVNDVDFDVALHIVFKDRKSHDAYQDAERHKKFIEENRDNWKKVRVFDSLVEK